VEMATFCIFLLACVLNCINAFNAYTPMNLVRTGRVIGRTLPVSSVRMHRGISEDTDATRCYLPLNSGMRVSRIVTASTNSYNAMLKLGSATSRLEIMKICMIRHKRTCVLTEHRRIPMTFGDLYRGWSYAPRSGSPVHANSGTSSSVLWVADIEKLETCQLELGSWLLATVPGNDDNHFNTLFSPSISQVHEAAQPILLSRPGFAQPKLVHTHLGLEWIIIFVELQQCDELGVPVSRVKQSAMELYM
jgi:hypothetical protein